MSSVANAAGSALLAVGKELPWIGPIAFLIGGVVQAAADVKALKGDARSFTRTVKNVEGVLVQAGESGSLDGARDACDALRECLEEGLAYCHRLQQQTFISSMLLAGRDTAKFEEISQDMMKNCQVVCTIASVTTTAMVRRCRLTSG